MSTDKTYLDRLNQVISAGLNLTGGQKGIEKESLRVTESGELAGTPHPIGLGSTLTHPYVTTDFSENLVELITAPFLDLKETLNSLSLIHQEVYRHLDQERLWCTSMPCLMRGEEDIPLARYGDSNVGKMKTTYRRGLGYRYGRIMQTISGVHFNYSVPQSFWSGYKDLLKSDLSSQDFASDQYFALVRNFQRHGWIISYLFGSSPAVCKSFLGRSSKGFLDLHGNTYYGKYSTSLRMSDIGYNNQNQATLRVSTNSIDEYVANLSRAIQTPFPPYERIGVKVDGEYRQLNTNILQIENEFYSFIRPKRSAFSGERPTTALQERGVEYVEVRALDVSPYDPLGVNEQQLRFVEAFLLYCLLSPSPPMDEEEVAMVKYNLGASACCGRAPGLELQRKSGVVKLVDWAREICESVAHIAEAMEASETGYKAAVQTQLEVLEHPRHTPSAKVLQELDEREESFFDFAHRKSREHEDYFRGLPLTLDQQANFERLASESLQQQRDIEASDEISFDEYLARYFNGA
ncbi:MAG: glutamate--cysteine ligase [Pseudomonadota bacterium]